MNSLDELVKHYDVLTYASYMTDLSIIPKRDTKILALRWYARIPFLGRVISYSRYLVCNPTLIQRQLLELSQKHETEFKASLLNFMETEDNWDDAEKKIYHHYTLIKQLFSQITHLPGSTCALKIDWPNFLQEFTFTNATQALDQLDTKNINTRKIVRFHALMKKIDPTAQILQKTSPIADKQSVLENLGNTKLFQHLTEKAHQIFATLDNLNPLEKFDMLETAEVSSLRTEFDILIKKPQFKNTFPAVHQEFSEVYQKLQPNLAALSNPELYSFAQKHPKYEKTVEQELAKRVPFIFGKLVARIIQQLLTYPKAKLAIDKLTQMVEDAKTQAPPTNLQEALNYLNQQRDVLSRVLGIAPLEAINSIVLPCADAFIKEYLVDNESNAKDSVCDCPIHKGLIDALGWHMYYSLQTEFNENVFNKIFDELIKYEPLMACQMILWNPRNTASQHDSAKLAIQKVYIATTPKNGTPFARLSAGGIKTQLLQLASHLDRKSELALFAEELAHFRGQWTFLEIELNGWVKGKRKDQSQFNHCRIAADFISTSAYFKKTHDKLYKAAKAFCAHFTPQLVNDVIEQIINYIATDKEKKNYALLPLRLINKNWNMHIERKIALEMPENLISMTDCISRWVLSKTYVFTDKNFWDKLNELREPLKKELEKLNAPKTFEGCKQYWEQIHLIVLRHITDISISLKDTDIHKRLKFPCLNSLIMGNIVNGKENSPKRFCCPIHKVFSSHLILTEFDKYINDREHYVNYSTSISLLDILTGLSKIDFEKMMVMAVAVYNQQDLDDKTLYMILDKDKKNWRRESFTTDFCCLMANLYSQFEDLFQKKLVSVDMLAQIQYPEIYQQTSAIVRQNFTTRALEFNKRSTKLIKRVQEQEKKI